MMEEPGVPAFSTVSIVGITQIEEHEVDVNCSSQSRSLITQPIAGIASIFLNAADFDYNFGTSSASGE
ncbi:hypothetical protein AB205_0219020 [Aquarana catesbeiana]|uniref:Uncharacterized protein n=1 Tax=Aquarana catesbeiana TaxID=8400 RepID=A0A2G9REC9_AQUCT|nr:hypothetical protein AB205_0219020 [Aquarana catesbeiana]